MIRRWSLCNQNTTPEKRENLADDLKGDLGKKTGIYVVATKKQPPC